MSSWNACMRRSGLLMAAVAIVLVAGVWLPAQADPEGPTSEDYQITLWVHA